MIQLAGTKQVRVNWKTIANWIEWDMSGLTFLEKILYSKSCGHYGDKEYTCELVYLNKENEKVVYTFLRNVDGCWDTSGIPDYWQGTCEISEEYIEMFYKKKGVK